MSLALALALDVASGAKAFKPTDIASLTLWLDPTRGLVANTSWTDQVSGLVLNYTSVAGSTAVAGTAINGTPTVDVTVGGYFTSVALLSSVISASAWSACEVFRYTGAVADTGHGYDGAVILADLNTYWTIGVSTTKLRGEQYDNTSYNADVSTVATSTNYYATHLYDGTKLYTSLNGGALDAGVASGHIGFLADTFRVGGNYNLSHTYAGSYGDILAFNAALSATDQAKVQAWLKTRSGS